MGAAMGAAMGEMGTDSKMCILFGLTPEPKNLVERVEIAANWTIDLDFSTAIDRLISFALLKLEITPKEGEREIISFQVLYFSPTTKFRCPVMMVN